MVNAFIALATAAKLGLWVPDVSAEPSTQATSAEIAHTITVGETDLSNLKTTLDLQEAFNPTPVFRESDENGDNSKENLATDASEMANAENFDDSQDEKRKNTVEWGKSNAEIAQAFEKDVGVELWPKFYDLIAQAREKLDERSYGWAVKNFQNIFKEKDPKTGGDLFELNEKQYLFGIAMDLLANKPENPSEGDLTITLEERDCLNYFRMGKKIYNFMLSVIESSKEIERMDAEFLTLQQKMEDLIKERWELSQEIIDELVAFYQDCLKINDLEMKRKFSLELWKTRDFYIRQQDPIPEKITQLQLATKSR